MWFYTCPYRENGKRAFTKHPQPLPCILIFSLSFYSILFCSLKCWLQSPECISLHTNEYGPHLENHLQREYERAVLKEKGCIRFSKKAGRNLVTDKSRRKFVTLRYNSRSTPAIASHYTEFLLKMFNPNLSMQAQSDKSWLWNIL